MSTNVVKTSKIVKDATSTVRAHLDAVQRARDIYLAHIKRAESEYFDRIKHITSAVTAEEVAAGNGATPEASDAVPATP